LKRSLGCVSPPVSPQPSSNMPIGRSWCDTVVERSPLRSRRTPQIGPVPFLSTALGTHPGAGPHESICFTPTSRRDGRAFDLFSPWPGRTSAKNNCSLQKSLSPALQPTTPPRHGAPLLFKISVHPVYHLCLPGCFWEFPPKMKPLGVQFLDGWIFV